jgi:hypothetical protein
MNTFTSFDGIQSAYHDEGEGPAVILLHGFGVDGLGQFGDFERILLMQTRPSCTNRSRNLTAAAQAHDASCYKARRSCMWRRSTAVLTQPGFSWIAVRQ